MARLLVIEGSRTQAKELAYVLEKAGFEVQTAFSTEQGLERLTRERFDLVLSGLLFPGASGLDLCRRIKADPERRHLPVVLISRWDDPESLLLGREAGADGFAIKGQGPAALVRSIQWAIAPSALSQRQAEGGEGGGPENG
jgi:DNA-binding response OmpR family regulator